MKTKLMKFSDGVREVSIGQEVVITNTNRRGGGYSLGVVSKIGNKLVEIKAKESSYVLASFYLEGGEKSQYSHNSIYSSVANYEAHTLISNFEYIVKYSHHSFRDVSEENLQAAIDLLGLRESFNKRLNESK